MDISLQATASVDSFAIHMVSSGADLSGPLNGVFTVRWESAAGGIVNASDVRPDCSTYDFQRLPPVTVGDYRYVTVVINAREALGEGCAITGTSAPIGWLRIHGLAGCRHVGIVNDLYTLQNNRDYYVSIGGTPRTGTITSGAIAAGTCGPCVPPVITSSTATHHIPCGGTGPLELDATAEPAPVTYAWLMPGSSTPFSTAPQVSLPDAITGTYTVIVDNACGSDQASVQVLPDTTVCVPPSIGSIAATGPGAGQVVHLYAEAAGSCTSVLWTGPGGEPVGAGMLDTYVSQAQPGTYTLVVVNACGADTAQVVANEDGSGCIPPMIVGTSDTHPTCEGDLLRMTMDMGGNSWVLFTFEWYDPLGAPMGSGAYEAVDPHPMEGTYMGIAHNACGADTGYFTVAFDTTGLATCTPPVIVDITNDGPVCTHDTLHVHVESIAAGPCLRYSWNYYGFAPLGNGDFIQPLPGTGTYTLIMFNACGADTASFDLFTPVDYPFTHVYCEEETDPPFSLEDLLYDHFPGGTWSLNGLPHAGLYDPAVDTTGTYIYQDPLGICGGVPLTIDEQHTWYAGRDSSVTVCSTDPPLELFPFLGPEAETGGYWTYGMMGSFDGVYDPEFDLPTNYRYYVSDPSGVCGDLAIVAVTELQATTWYADADGDGMGDTAQVQMACEPPAGHVADGTDACPLIFGTIGSPCDDGLPYTVNDVLDPACTCTGDFVTGVDPALQGDFAVLPNPLTGDAWTLVITDAVAGPATFELYDVAGRCVLRRQLAIAGAEVRLTIWPDAPLPAGLYAARLETRGKLYVTELMAR